MQNGTIASQQTPTVDSPDTGVASMPRQKDRPFIMAVTRNGHMSEHVMDYAVNVAHRMQYGILAVHVDTLPFFKDSGKRSKLFAAAMRESAILFKKKAANKQVMVEHLGEIGKIDRVVSRLCHAKKRIEFVVIDKGIRLKEVARQSPVPVFPVITTRTGQTNRTIFHNPKAKGVFTMSTTSRKRHVKNCFLFGALTAGLYASVFTHQDLVMTYFAKGGLYAVLPVMTVLAVSYLHGNFTSSFWSALGIEASKKSAVKRVQPQQKVTDTAVTPRPDTRPRIQVNA
jgi:hypothetical protein